jgi:hypothetical protein
MANSPVRIHAANKLLLAGEQEQKFQTLTVRIVIGTKQAFATGNSLVIIQ